MNARAALVCFLFLACGATAAPRSLPGQQPIQSASGQFTVLRDERPGGRVSPAFLSGSDLLHLDPDLLAISAERLRQYLTRDLQDSSPWEGRVLFSLHGTASFNPSTQIVAEWMVDRWRYRVSLPEYVPEDRFVRTLVEVDLMEIANRNSTGRPTEIPAWLTEGFTGHLLASRSLEIILPAPKLRLHGVRVTPWQVEERRYQPLAVAHARLQTNAPLTIEQLSWPAAGAFEGRKGDTYRDCAQLLVARLVQLPDGQALMSAFLRNLSRHYNWQVAFLNTYHEQFATLLDFEKWWALQVAQFTGRDLSSNYGYAESVLHLKEAVRFPVQVRLGTNALPLHGEVPLQAIIEEWDLNRQTRALKQTLRELVVLRARIAPELIGLLDDYRLTLEKYLQNRNRRGIYLPKGMNNDMSLTLLVRSTLKTLDRLDAELAGLLPEPTDHQALTNSDG